MCIFSWIPIFFKIKDTWQADLDNLFLLIENLQHDKKTRLAVFVMTKTSITNEIDVTLNTNKYNGRHRDVYANVDKYYGVTHVLKNNLRKGNVFIEAMKN